MIRTWQDLTLAASSLFFIVALLPTVLDIWRRPPRATSVPTAVTLAATAVVYGSMALWFAAVTTAITALLWGLIAL